ncbi:MAG: CvpA family protein [Planctomycetota bacterium]
MYFGIVLGIVFFITFAMMVAEGLWSNTIALMQIVFSGIVAFGFAQPITVWADEYTDGEYTYALDIVVLWFLFALSMILLKIFAELLSKTRAKFVPQVDTFGGALVGLVAGAVMAGIVGATLHTAPLPKDGLGGGMDYPPGDLSDAGWAAVDIHWLRLVEAAAGAGLTGDASFTAEDFVAVYGAHRKSYAENAEGLKVRRKG